VEDSIAGLKSAIFAGVDVVFYKGGSHHIQNPQNTKNILAHLQNFKNSTLLAEINDLTEIFKYI
jgi:beta-phosphoglucomutase-like phosphatase (HAD superfamily)